MRLVPAIVLLSCTAFALPALADAAHPPAPLLDGDCAEYAALGARTDTIADGVVLHAYQDRDYVWLCYTLPAESFGGLDLRVESDALPAALNLHVSAQLGEWPADRPEQAPQDGNSPLWWNHRGWTAHWIRFNGMDATATPPRPRFRLGGARELQLSRQRFGTGEWRLVFDIHRVRQADGGYADLRYPQAGAYRVPGVRATRSPGPSHRPAEGAQPCSRSSASAASSTVSRLARTSATVGETATSGFTPTPTNSRPSG